MCFTMFYPYNIVYIYMCVILQLYVHIRIYIYIYVFSDGLFVLLGWGVRME